MENKNFVQPEEDLVQKTLHGEADLLGGMMKYKYESMWSFVFGCLMAEFFIFWAILIGSILLTGIINAVNDNALFYDSFIIGAVIMALGGSALFFFGYKISKRLFISFKRKNKKFKNKAIILMAFPTFLAILILILICSQVLPSMGFSY